MYVHCRQYFHDITDHGDAKSVSYFLYICKGKSIFLRVQLIMSATLTSTYQLITYTATVCISCFFNIFEAGNHKMSESVSIKSCENFRNVKKKSCRKK